MSFGKKYRNHCFKQESSLHFKISEQNCEGKQDICIVLKYLPIVYLLIIERKSNFTVEKGGPHHLNEIIKVSITINDAY